MPRKPKTVAETLARVAEQEERQRDREVRYVRVGRPPKPASERGQVYSIRVPVERLEQLRSVAEAEGKQPAVLARDWILERLDDEASTRHKPTKSRRVPSKQTAVKHARRAKPSVKPR